MKSSNNDNDHSQNPVLLETDNESDQLQQIARNRIIEPFEGRKSLEKLQKTRSQAEKSIVYVKKAGAKTGKWISETKLAGFTKTRVSMLIQGLKKTSYSSAWAELTDRIDTATRELLETTRATYIDIEEKARSIALSYVQKGLELLMYENTEEWIIKRATDLLGRSDLLKLENIRQLKQEEQILLIESLFPYDSVSYQDFAKTFDLSLNVGMGAIVATNLPGTGLVISLINMAKTLVKMGNRLNIMSAIYGYQIVSSAALFKVCTMILQSLDDWENNENHVPLNPNILDILYSQPDKENEASFQDMINAVVKKDAYIAIPGVGMISLGKINLDDLKMDLVIKHLVQDYFTEKRVKSVFEKIKISQIINDYKMIYSAFIKHNYFKTARKQIEDEQLQGRGNKWKLRMKILGGIDLALQESSQNLDHFAKDIFLKIQTLDPKTKKNVIEAEIEAVFKDIKSN